MSRGADTLPRWGFLLLMSALAGCGGGEAIFHSPDGRQMIVCNGDGYRACRDAALKRGSVEGPPAARPVTPLGGR